MSDRPGLTLEQLVERYCHGEMTADDYYAQVDELARVAIAVEIRDMAARRKGQRS